MLDIEILRKPEDRTDYIERILTIAAKLQNIPIQIKKTQDFRQYGHLAINPSQTPVIIIKGNVEFSGKAIDVETVKRRLVELAFRS